MIYTDPTKTHLNRKSYILPAMGATVRVRVGDELVTGVVQGIADLMDGEEVTGTYASVLTAAGRVVVSLHEIREV